MAFTRSAGRAIIKRDREQCQGLGGACLTSCVMGESFMARIKDGYFLTAAHYVEVHHLTGVGYHDTNTRNGRALCGLCHSAEEILRGNSAGARLLLQMGIFHINAVRSGARIQWYPTVEEVENYILAHQSKLIYYFKRYSINIA